MGLTPDQFRNAILGIVVMMCGIIIMNMTDSIGPTIFGGAIMFYGLIVLLTTYGHGK